MHQQTTDTSKEKDIFQTEFDNDPNKVAGQVIENANQIEAIDPVYKTAKLFDYSLRFSNDYLVSGFNNQVLVNRFQPYAGGSGPIYLSNTDIVNGIIRMGISDLFEDIKFMGGFRISTNLRDNDYFASFQNLRKRLDWGLTYFRSIQKIFRFMTQIRSLLKHIYPISLSQIFTRVIFLFHLTR